MNAVFMVLAFLLLLILGVLEAYRQYRNGYERGLDKGYDEGKQEGLSRGRAEGFQEGRAVGYKKGVKVGFEAGRQKVRNCPQVVDEYIGEVNDDDNRD